MRLLDLFCGRFGWGRTFAARGWEVVGVDLVEPPEVPAGCTFVKADILELCFWGSFGLCRRAHYDGYSQDIPLISESYGKFDFICASSPCEQFSVHGMKHFHPNPLFPEMGIRLFNHTRAMCEASGLPYVMENVKHAQDFVGRAVNHCGSFYLWGNAVPPIFPQGITKAKWTMNMRGRPGNAAPECWMPAKRRSAILATIPPELSACVCDYAERLIEQAA